MKKEIKVEVVQDEKEVISVKILAKSIKDIADAATRMEKAGLNRRAMLVLLKDASGVSMAEIGRVIDAQRDLARIFLK